MGFLSFGILLLSACGTLQTPEYRGASFRGPSSDAKVYYSKTNGPLTLSLPTKNYQFVRGFKKARAGRRPHKGLDLDGITGDPIFAAHSGVVVYAGTGFTGYGKMILIEYDGTWATLYAHLNRFHVRTGDVVSRGDRIGDMGRTGRATGSHLHFELMRNKQPIDPVPFLRKDTLLTINN